jgi:hypothetical protein
MKKISNDALKKYMSAIIMLIVLCGLAGAGRAKIASHSADLGIPTAPPTEHTRLRASIVDEKLSRFTLDIQQFANIGVRDNAPTYAIYTQKSLPSTCGDFSSRDITYWEPSKFKRSFDLRKHKDVAKAFKEYGCVIVKSNQSRGKQDES